MTNDQIQELLHRYSLLSESRIFDVILTNRNRMRGFFSEQMPNLYQKNLWVFNEYVTSLGETKTVQLTLSGNDIFSIKLAELI